MARAGASGASQVILATAGYDHTIRFWDATTSTCYRTLQHADSVRSLLLSMPLRSLTDGSLLSRTDSP